LLAFEHPMTGEFMEFTAEMPEDMQNLVEAFRNGGLKD
jgi:23S rRNA pseudouridine1911/1915/1917 synthase